MILQQKKLLARTIFFCTQVTFFTKHMQGVQVRIVPLPHGPPTSCKMVVWSGSALEYFSYLRFCSTISGCPTLPICVNSNWSEFHGYPKLRCNTPWPSIPRTRLWQIPHPPPQGSLRMDYTCMPPHSGGPEPHMCQEGVSSAHAVSVTAKLPHLLPESCLALELCNLFLENLSAACVGLFVWRRF